MTATAAVSRAATVSLCDLIAREPERTATGQRIAHLWQRTLHQPADDCRFAIADLVNTKRLERTGPSQWTTTTAHHRLVAAFEAIVKKNELVAPPVPFAEPEEDTGDPTDDDGAADDPKAAYDDDPPESVRTLPVGHTTVTLNAGADPSQQVKVSGPRTQVDAVVRAYLRQRVAGKADPLLPISTEDERVVDDLKAKREAELAARPLVRKATPLAPRVSAMAPTADLETVRAKASRVSQEDVDEALASAERAMSPLIGVDKDVFKHEAVRIAAQILEKRHGKALADAREKRLSTLAPVARRIYDFIVSKPDTTPSLHARKALADIPYNTLRGRVSELHTNGLIRRRDDGVWEAT